MNENRQSLLGLLVGVLVAVAVIVVMTQLNQTGKQVALAVLVVVAFGSAIWRMRHNEPPTPQ